MSTTTVQGTQFHELGECIQILQDYIVLSKWKAFTIVRNIQCQGLRSDMLLVL